MSCSWPELQDSISSGSNFILILIIRIFEKPLQNSSLYCSLQIVYFLFLALFFYIYWMAQLLEFHILIKEQENKDPFSR